MMNNFLYTLRQEIVRQVRHKSKGRIKTSAIRNGFKVRSENADDAELMVKAANTTMGKYTERGNR